jgi:hypothetical protein
VGHEDHSGECKSLQIRVARFPKTNNIIQYVQLNGERAELLCDGTRKNSKIQQKCSEEELIASGSDQKTSDILSFFLA